MGIAFVVIGCLLLGAGLFFYIRDLRAFVKNHALKGFVKSDLIHFGAYLALIGLGGAVIQPGLFILNSYAYDGGHLALSIIFSFFFCAFFALLWGAFYIRFYRPELDKAQMKWVKICLYGSIPLSLASFLAFMEGVAPYLSYPLSSGFVINETGFHLVSASHHVSGGFHVAWYGVIIVFGALVSYFISDHRFYQKYHKHGILEVLLLVAFPCGIIGARIWYVVGNWNGDGAGGLAFSTLMGTDQWWRIFAIWEGGLTILGGAVGGIIGGVTYMRIKRKYVDIRWAMDMIVPTILIAQAIGRWGNFFNCEVYGATVSLNSGWQWLPTFIAKQMNVNNSLVDGSYYLAEGMIHVPLFLVEGMLNIAGYFLIAYGVPAVWKKYRSNGNLAAFYMIWYGTVRMIMEPLRDPSFNMGTNGNWSYWNSLVYILIGVAMIGAFELYDYIKSKRTPKPIEGETEAKAEETDGKN